MSEEDEDDDEDWEGDEESTETVVGKQYKNPRNSPSTLCPRDEEQATLLVSVSFGYILNNFGDISIAFNTVWGIIDYNDYFFVFAGKRYIEAKHQL